MIGINIKNWYLNLLDYLKLLIRMLEKIYGDIWYIIKDFIWFKKRLNYLNIRVYWINVVDIR